jgi:predicted ATPase/DNA-binding CsgD family transcriptional regulator/DNA-binding XRE family transcriptional regulator
MTETTGESGRIGEGVDPVGAPARPLGALLRGHRRAAGLTQEGLAERAGLSPRGLQHLEAGDSRPYPATLEALAVALDLTPAERAGLREALPAAPPRPRPADPADDPWKWGPGVGADGSTLPTPLTSFVGRRHELAEVARLLGATRLLTLTGPGGVGKTRVALAVAAGLREAYADGAVFVPLAPVADPGLVAATVARAARALRVPEARGRPPVERLTAALRGRQLLLVLDNFEHVAAAGPLLVELLAACPRLTVLVTSRARLRLSGEQAFPVPPLTLPEGAAADRSPVPPAALLGYEAVRLFVERARAARPDFVLTAADAPAVAEVCRRLDGLPLALELAAPRIALLPPRALLVALERRLPLLTGGARDLPARHRTLRAALAWSEDLLAPPEQALFRRLGVFAGGATPDAAAAVCADFDPSDGVLPATAVLDALAALADASLLQPEEQPDGGVRLGLLETVREYALERLAAAGEAEALRARHAAHFLALAEAAAPHLHSPDQGPAPGPPAAPGPADTRVWLDRLEAEHPNLRMALGWWEARSRSGAAESAAPAAGLRLAGALWRFWYLRGHWREGREWLTRVLAHRHRAPPAAQARALFGAGFPGWCGGDFEPAGAWLREYLALCREGVDGADEAAALYTLGFLAAFRGDDARAEALGEAALTRARTSGAARAVAWALSLLRRQALRRGDLARAAALGQEALAGFRVLGDAEAASNALAAAGHLARRRGDPAGAAAHYAESLALFRDLGSRHGVATRLVDLGHAALEQGERLRAVERFAEGASRHRDVGDGQGVAAALTGLARAAAAARRPRAAVQLLAAARTALGAGAARLDRITEELYEGTLAAARAALSAPAFAAAWGEGLAWSPERAVEASRRVLAEAAPASPRGSKARTAAAATATPPLTPREREVAALVGDGGSDRAVARALGISERTAENHVRHILGKLGGHSRERIAAWAAEHGLVDEDRRPRRIGPTTRRVGAPPDAGRGRDRSA